MADNLFELDNSYEIYLCASKKLDNVTCEETIKRTILECVKLYEPSLRYPKTLLLVEKIYKEYYEVLND